MNTVRDMAGTLVNQQQGVQDPSCHHKGIQVPEDQLHQDYPTYKFTGIVTCNINFMHMLRNLMIFMFVYIRLSYV